LILAVITLLIIPTLASAQKAPETIGRTQTTGDTIEWPLVADADSVMLTVVSPDGETSVTSFNSGRTPSVRLRDLGFGKIPPDGTYRYELRLTPRISASVKAQLKAAREKNDEAGARRIMRDNGILFTNTQSGGFTVVGGAILNPDAAEGGTTGIGKLKAAGTAKSSASGSGESIMKLIPKADDQVIPDDLIVQGSACVGLDCVNNESFGFDTIRLKENNTRIKFDDTSTSAGFANNDWQLTANDSGGGLNKFSIDDITNSKTPFTILGSAPSNSIYVDTNGKVGFRTSSPGLDIHISTGDTPAIRQEQTNASGFTAQTWDIGGNEANWFVRDLTGGSRLPFRIRPGAPTSSVDISASGNVGIGTASPGTLLDVVRTDTAATIIRSNANNASGIAILRATSGTGTTSPRFAYFEATSAETSGADWRAGLHGSKDFKISDFSTGSEANRFIIANSNGFIGLGGQTSPTSPIHHANGATLSTGGVWTDASSRDLKEDICDLDTQAAEQTLAQLNPVTFRYKAEPTDAHVGFIAEDVPDLVATQGRKGLAPMDIVAVLTKVVQEQQKTIEQLSAKVDQLEKKQQQ
jgi:hypothetical protein